MRYFKDSDVAVLLIFTALIGLITLPFIWFIEPKVASLSPGNAALMAFSGVLIMGAMLFYLRALAHAHLTERAAWAKPSVPTRLPGPKIPWARRVPRLCPPSFAEPAMTLI